MPEKYDEHWEEGDYVIVNKGGWKRKFPKDKIISISREGGWSYIERRTGGEMHKYDDAKDMGDRIVVNKGGWKKEIMKTSVYSVKSEGGWIFIEHD
jgi:hypothetical protein